MARLGNRGEDCSITQHQTRKGGQPLVQKARGHFWASCRTYLFLLNKTSRFSCLILVPLVSFGAPKEVAPAVSEVLRNPEACATQEKPTPKQERRLDHINCHFGSSLLGDCSILVLFPALATLIVWAGGSEFLTPLPSGLPSLILKQSNTNTYE